MAYITPIYTTVGVNKINPTTKRDPLFATRLVKASQSSEKAFFILARMMSIPSIIV